MSAIIFPRMFRTFDGGLLESIVIWKVNSKKDNVIFEAFRIYSDSRYQVCISQCQQLALQKACGPVPLPSEQLQLANKKKDKEPRAYHVRCIFFFNIIVFFWLNVSPKTHIMSLTNVFWSWSIHTRQLNWFISALGRYHGSKEIFGGGKRQLAGWVDCATPRTNERSGAGPTLLRLCQPSAEAALHPESCDYL